jgi:hypothetical protein
MAAEAQRFVLFGTGDWGEWCDDLLGSLAGGGHVAVVAAGQVDNGADAVESYRAGTRDRFARIGVACVDVPLLVAGDGDRPEALATLEGAVCVYVTGGGPRSSIEALAGSAFMRVVVAERIPYVGSSGGAMLLGARCPLSLAFERTAAALGVFPHTVIAAHWNELDDMRPGLRDAFVRDAGSDTLVGLDRDTGIAGDGQTWQAVGPNRVHVHRRGTWTTYRHGDTFELPLLTE